MPNFLDGSDLLKRLSLEVRKEQSVDLAVAFWGAGAAKSLELQKGTGARIICNLMSGGTNPREISTLRECGVEVRQLNNLHAKIGVVGDISFVGSSNMSANGLGAEGSAANWLEANVVYDRNRPEIAEMFEKYWLESDAISESDLEAAKVAWAERQRANAAQSAKQGVRGLVDVLRTSPEVLDALNVRMVVYDTVTDAEELDVLKNAEDHASDLYGQTFSVYWNWPSLASDAANAFLIDYDWPSRGRIARGTLYRRNSKEFPDFKQDGETFHAAYEVDDIEGITFSVSDKEAIRTAFHGYVRNGAASENEGQRAYNFLVSELAKYLPPAD